MEKKMFSTLLRNDLLKEFKKLAIDLERPANDLLEEAMQDLCGPLANSLFHHRPDQHLRADNKLEKAYYKADA